MKVLVVGSTGVIGRPTVRRLVAERHEVRALVRESSTARALPEGADVVVGDLLDAASLDAALVGCEAVVNVASAIPTGTDPSPAAWDRNDSVRTTGTSNLLYAMRTRGVRRLVHTSVHLVYGNDRGDELLDEAADLRPPQIVATAVEGERLVEESGVTATILRPGWLYDSSSWHTQQLLAEVKAGRTRVVEGAPAWRSPIAADDVAAAIALSLQQPSVRQPFNLAANPIRWSDLADGLAQRIGAPPPHRLSREEAASLPARERAALLRSVRLDSSAARRLLGFRPRWSDTTEALAAIAEK